MDLDRLKKGADVARDVAAVLFVPVICLMAVGSTILMVWGPWTLNTEGERLLYVGIGHIVIVALIACGVFFYQRRDLPKVIIHTPAGEFTLDTATQAVTPPAPVAAVTVSAPAPNPAGVTVNNFPPVTPPPANPVPDAPMEEIK